MPIKPPVSCGRCGGTYTESQCPACGPTEGKKRADSYAIKSKRPNFKEYHGQLWKELRAARIRGNPVCQLIENEIQCKEPSKYAHHLIPPTENDKTKMFDPKNIVMLCKHHHDNRPGESPNDPRNFADSIFRGGERLVHPKHPSTVKSLSSRLTGLPE